eukprot:scaffold2752_cov393-Prasinococcus_capsulatus_cf.AAC.35
MWERRASCGAHLPLPRAMAASPSHAAVQGATARSLPVRCLLTDAAEQRAQLEETGCAFQRKEQLWASVRQNSQHLCAQAESLEVGLDACCTGKGLLACLRRLLVSVVAEASRRRHGSVEGRRVQPVEAPGRVVQPCYNLGTLAARHCSAASNRSPLTMPSQPRTAGQSCASPRTVGAHHAARAAHGARSPPD